MSSAGSKLKVFQPKNASIFSFYDPQSMCLSFEIPTHFALKRAHNCKRVTSRGMVEVFIPKSRNKDCVDEEDFGSTPLSGGGGSKLDADNLNQKSWPCTGLID